MFELYSNILANIVTTFFKVSLPQIRKGKVRLLLDQGNGVHVENDDDLHGIDVDVDDEHRADDDLRLSESWGT